MLNSGHFGRPLTLYRICLIVNKSYSIGGVLARKKQWSERMEAPFPAGTFERISVSLSDGESRTDFVRAAVDNEITRRHRKAKATSTEIRPSLGASSVKKPPVDNK